MQAATAEAPRSGRETLIADNGVAGMLQPDVNLNATRYFVQMGFNMVSVATHAIPHSRMWRGDIVPCRTVALPDALHAIPETERIPGSERPTGTDGRLSVADRRHYAWHEANALLNAEDKTDKKSCIFEIKSLYSELGHRLYRELDVTRLFFPEWPYLPERTVEVVDWLESRVAAIKNSPPDGIPSELQPQVALILEGIGRELIEAAMRTQDYQRQEILYTHQCMKLRPNEERYKPRYDSRDLEILTRTGLPQIDAAELQTAESLNILAKQAAGSGDDNGALMKLVETQQESNALLRAQLEQQGQMLQMLLADRQTAKAETKTEAPADTAPKNTPKGR